MLSARFGKIANLNRAYVQLRQIKSAEELNWMRIGAAFIDRGMSWLRNSLRPGLTERESRRNGRAPYISEGGTNVIHFFGVTSMFDAHVAVPAQYTANRKVKRGDIVFAEISVAFWEHPGQVLRSFAVGEDPPKLYRELHAAADAAFDAIARALKRGALPKRGDRGLERDRGLRLDHPRRSAARLRRRLYAAGAGSHSRPAGRIPD